MGVVFVYKMENVKDAVCLMASEIAHEDAEASETQLLLLLQHRPDYICSVPAAISVALFRLVSLQPDIL